MAFNKTDSKLELENPSNKPVVVFGLFKDLNSPFESEQFKSPFPQCSPIRGINKDFLKNLRLHGHYGPNKGLPRPNWRGDTEKFPQDWTASLLEFFAPSYVGFLFDSHHTTPFHDWLAPENIALIFNTMIEDSFYLHDWFNPQNTKLKTKSYLFEDSRDSVLKLAKCLQPKVNYKQLEIDESKGRNFKQAAPKYRAFSKISCLSWPTKELPFAEILYNALNETKGDGAAKLGYPDHIVERILLTYMWERKKSKLDLKPFYDNLSENIIDKSQIAQIIWEGTGSFYIEKDYFKVVTKYNEKRCMTLEDQTLLQLGYPHFESVLLKAMGKVSLHYSQSDL